MTCIVGIEAQDGSVWIGGDSAVTDNNGGRSVLTTPKVFQSGEMVVGICGSMRLGQILQYLVPNASRPHDLSNDMVYLVGGYISMVQQVLKEVGYISTPHGVDFIGDGEWLLGYRGRLYQVNVDFQVLHSMRPYVAIGMGADLALGALYQFGKRKKVSIHPQEAIESALEAAVEHNSTCAPPWKILQLSNKMIVDIEE